MTQPQDNNPDIWKDALPDTAGFTHKYDRGHGVFFGGAEMTGATCLSAYAATRMGLGLATIAADKSSVDTYRVFMPHIIARAAEGVQEKTAAADHDNVNTIIIGPGYGNKDELKKLMPELLSLKNKKYVLDADALTAFAGNAQELFGSLDENCVLTPHEGEFKKLFGDYDADKLAITRLAAEKSGAVIVHKGQETIIAAPDGRVVRNGGSPWLATAGSGDVLTGFIAGLIGQGMPTFESACAAVWMHVKCAENFGAGLVAADIPDLLPEVLEGFYHDAKF